MYIHSISNALYTGILSLPSERLVISKDRDSGLYRMSSYFLAKTVAEIPLLLILPTIWLIISYWMAGMNPNGLAFIGMLGVQLLSVLGMESIGLLVGKKFFHSFKIILYYGVFNLIFILIFILVL